jgi:hypothetical protein
MKTAPLSTSRGLLSLPSHTPLWLGCSLIATIAAATAQTNGRWTGATSSVAPAANYTEPTNWESGLIADGADAVANYVFNPISDNGAAGVSLAGGTVFDAPRTLGYMVFEDIAGFGGATIGLRACPAINRDNYKTANE